VNFFRQDGRHSAVALLLKAALIQVSDCRLLGASGFFIIKCQECNKNRQNVLSTTEEDHPMTILSKFGSN
jgi:hypothetical protein